MAKLTHLATMQPSCNSRTWSSNPHPHLPIMATACADKTARIYSLQTFRQQSSISGGHKRSIRSCAWKPNSKGESVLATGSFDASAGIWRRWEDGTLMRQEMDFTSGLAGGDKQSDDEDDEWRFAVILDGHDSEIKSLAFSSTAPLLATCSRDKSVWIWEELEDDNFETVAVLQDHEGDVKTVAWHPSEELLASGSYDDNIRLWREDVDDWACCSLLEGHEGTVWWVEFEEVNNIYSLAPVDGDLNDAQKRHVDLRLNAGPRLISCSDDMSIRVWRRIPRQQTEPSASQVKAPTIWKNNNFEEKWVEETRLPQVHERPIYSVSWSRKTGRVVSTGSDGKIVVYQETWANPAAAKSMILEEDPELALESKDSTARADTETGQANLETSWEVVAEIDNAHDVFEINHVVWAPRADKAKRHDDEEVIVSTGDDGEVKVWVLDL